MARVADEQLVSALGRMVVTEVSPHELMEFEAISQSYFRNPQFVVPAKTRKDGSVGLAMMGTLSYLSPLILAVANEIVIQFFADKLQSSFAHRSKSLWARLRHSFRSSESGPADTSTHQRLPLRPDQLVEVRRVAFEKARQLNLPEAQATILADAMVGSLTLLAVDDRRLTAGD